MACFEEYGNPFADDSGNLYCLTTKDVTNLMVTRTTNSIYQTGLQQYNQSVQERFVNKTIDVQNTIPQNKLSLLRGKRNKSKSVNKGKLSVAKNECELFSKLYIACQNLEGNLDTFFEHENQPFSSSLLYYSVLCFGTK